MSVRRFCGWTSFLSNFFQEWLEKLFYKLGFTVSHRPLTFLLSGIVLAVACAVGFLNFKLETRIDYLVCICFDTYTSYHYQYLNYLQIFMWLDTFSFQ